MNIYMFPPQSAPNPYIENVISGLESKGCNVVNRNMTTKSQRLYSIIRSLFDRTNVYHFNWIENYAVKDNLIGKIASNLILAWINILKTRNKTIVWTVHNKKPHDLNCSQDKCYQYFMRKFIPLVDLFIMHAKETKTFLIDSYGVAPERTLYVPHGAYASKGLTAPPSDCFRLVSFGLISKYKNIPVLIKAFMDFSRDRKCELCIYGKCNDVNLLQEITTICNASKSVIFDNRYVPEEEIDNLYDKTTFVVLPYDTASMINSGAAILAFSHGRPIISSRFGTIIDIEEKNFVLSYDYSDEETHVKELCKQMEKAYDIWVKTPEYYTQMVTNAYTYAKEELSWESICSKIIEEYQNCIVRK